MRTALLSLILFATVLGQCVRGANVEARNEVMIFVVDDFSSNSLHGTEVVSVVKGSSFGFCPFRQLSAMPYDSYINSLQEIISYCDNHPAVRVVVNISLESAGSEQVEESLIKRLCGMGVLVVAAAGNEHASILGYPAAYDGVFAVAAVERGRCANYSNHSKQVAISADGEQDSFEGTSIAAPRVAGLAAYLLARNPAMTPQQAARLLKSTASDLHDDLYFKGELGAGELNPTGAMLMADPEYQAWIGEMTILFLLGLVGTLSGVRLLRRLAVSSDHRSLSILMLIVLALWIVGDLIVCDSVGPHR
jgi:subtilisin family serine protease